MRYTSSQSRTQDSGTARYIIDALETVRQVYGPHDDGIGLIVFEQACKFGKVTIGQDKQLCEAHTSLHHSWPLSNN